MNRFIQMALYGFLALTIAGCNSTNGVTTVNTQQIATQANVVLTIGQEVLAASSVATHASQEDLSKINDAIDDIKALNSQIALSTGGTVTVDTSSKWAKSLFADLTQIINVSKPIVQKYDPDALTYLNTASALLPLLQQMAIITTNGAVSAKPILVSENPVDVRALDARLYLGIPKPVR